MIKSLYVGDTTQLGYDPTTSFIITYIAKLVHARYNLAGENLKLNIKSKCTFQKGIIKGKGWIWLTLYFNKIQFDSDIS